MEAAPISSTREEPRGASVCLRSRLHVLHRSEVITEESVTQAPDVAETRSVSTAMQHSTVPVSLDVSSEPCMRSQNTFLVFIYIDRSCLSPPKAPLVKVFQTSLLNIMAS